MTELASAHMPLVERLRKGANCVVFLDGAPEPAADVADMLRKAADEIVWLRAAMEHIVRECGAMHKGPAAVAIARAALTAGERQP